MENKSNIIIYRTDEGQASVSLYAKDSSLWMNLAQAVALQACVQAPALGGAVYVMVLGHMLWAAFLLGYAGHPPVLFF